MINPEENYINVRYLFYTYQIHVPSKNSISGNKSSKLSPLTSKLDIKLVQKKEFTVFLRNNNELVT